MLLTNQRRLFIKQFVGLLASICCPLPSAHALWPTERYSANPLAITLTQIFKDQAIVPTNQISINIPFIAENGAVVPISVSTSLLAVQKIYLLVEKNPVPLVAEFTLSEGMQAFVSARLKMAETSDVVVIAETKSALFSARTNVKVTIGGCGG